MLDKNAARTAIQPVDDLVPTVASQHASPSGRASCLRGGCTGLGCPRWPPGLSFLPHAGPAGTTAPCLPRPTISSPFSPTSASRR
ncbi:hypothetical protein Ga0061061_106284 [Chelatococcus sambhunathii]|uniref:Uncharacterized protein n=1 Tax=Chelatococcus sambhunathii TaxID=363953 RepID=A0ABM9U6I3_9HYPH|nr:hypothetical protein Ga0061061_106284 [Chelatococcus sambhunathii]